MKKPKDALSTSSLAALFAVVLWPACSSPTKPGLIEDPPVAAGDAPRAPWLDCRLDIGGAETLDALSAAIIASIATEAPTPQSAQLVAGPCQYTSLVRTTMNSADADASFEEVGAAAAHRLAGDSVIPAKRLRESVALATVAHTTETTPCGRGGEACHAAQVALAPKPDGGKLTFKALAIGDRWFLASPVHVQVPTALLVADLKVAVERAFETAASNVAAGWGVKQSQDLAVFEVASGIMRAVNHNQLEAQRVLFAVIDASEPSPTVNFLERVAALEGGFRQPGQTRDHEASDADGIESSPDVDEDPIKKVGAYSYIIDHAALAQAHPDLSSTINSTNVRVIPNYVEGAEAGIKIVGVRVGSPVRALGIRSSDVVLTIADHAVDFQGQLGALSDALARDKAFEIKILRRGRPITLDYKPR